jgi:hypothetical protein
MAAYGSAALWSGSHCGFGGVRKGEGASPSAGAGAIDTDQEDAVADSGPQIATPVHLEREDVTDEELKGLGVNLSDFPGSTAADFKRYPVLSEGGWYIVVKHQKTLETVSKEKWRLLGPIHLVSDGLHLA